MAVVSVEIPEPLRAFADGAGELNAEGATVGAALNDLATRYPLLVQRVLTRGGALRPHVNFFVNDADVRGAGGLEKPLQEGDLLTIVPSVAGG